MVLIVPVPDALDALYKAIMSAGTLGILAAVWKIASRVGGIEQWIKTTDKEVSSHGSLLQQLVKQLAEFSGWMKGRKE